MISWSTFQSLALLIGPILYRKLKSLYRSSRVTTPPLPLPASTRRTLNVLFLTGFLALALTFFNPENIFALTQSRLFHTPTDVVFTRLSKYRALTDADEVLRARLQSREARTAYARYGPTPLAECNWCSVDQPETFFYYLLPRVVMAHLLHVLVLGLVTSGAFSRWGRIWRTQATIGGLGLLLLEVVALRNLPIAHEHTAVNVSFVFWRVRLLRGIGMALVDAGLGFVIWLTATRRWNYGWAEKLQEERLEGLEKNLGAAAGVLQGTSYVKQGVMRDEALRRKMVDFWENEVRAGKEVEMDEEVMKVKIESLPDRLDMVKLEEEAKVKSEGLMRNIRAMRPPRKTEREKKEE